MKKINNIYKLHQIDMLQRVLVIKFDIKLIILIIYNK